jgi:hypothetical protein
MKTYGTSNPHSLPLSRPPGEGNQSCQALGSSPSPVGVIPLSHRMGEGSGVRAWGAERAGVRVPSIHFHSSWLALCLFSMALANSAARAQTPAPAPAPPAAAEAAPPKAEVNFPGIVVRAKEKTVEAEGAICLNAGILEFLAVTAKTPQIDREYESVLALKCKPSHLKAALLLIGCQEGDVSGEVLGPRLRPGDKLRPKGERLKMTVEWKQDDKLVRVPADELLLDRATGKPAKDLPWTFTGSAFGKDWDGKPVFLGDTEGAFVSLWYGMSALVNLDARAGNPYHGDKEGFEINKKLIPKIGTPIKLILERASKPATY